MEVEITIEREWSNEYTRLVYEIVTADRFLQRVITATSAYDPNTNELEELLVAVDEFISFFRSRQLVHISDIEKILAVIDCAEIVIAIQENYGG